jgi:cholesterol oxidase
MNHEASTYLGRLIRAIPAWLLNRGLRDAWQGWSAGGGSGSFAQWIDALKAMASHAGDTRLLEYDLQLHADNDSALPLAGALRGVKTIAYGRAANPWVQLQQVTMTAFPGLPVGRTGRLDVDMTWFRKADSLLLQIVDQQDAPSAIADFAAYGGYLLRSLLHVHLWTFRLPDAAPSYAPRRLPGVIAGIPAPEVARFVVDAPADAAPVVAQLTRYRGTGIPIVMIHGYSASGTTFAHPAIPEGGLGPYLRRHHGRDVWILDLRSSCGMPGARGDWSFEQVGYVDIPLAVEHVLRATGAQKVDIVAHCMGSAMLCMALFGREEARPEAHDKQPGLRKALRTRIRRLVLSQVGPRLQMAPANVFRAQAMRYLQHFLPLEDYTFRPEGVRGPGEDAVDRLLASVPYPADELLLESPAWPLNRRLPWLATRHRMDALYGVTFRLANMPDAVLARIDDFFGPLNVRTATQVIHFTRWRQITDSRGRALYTDHGQVSDVLSHLKVLSLHSDRNGLVDFATYRDMQLFLEDGHEVVALEGAGHQDALIGRHPRREGGRDRAPDAFARIAHFLTRD